ncbi:hypothetical protein SSCG_03601 [Streptomyces clavuligerus]|nr:hypothetical protein SSCG_03601 [Streptomyces clavuligerus]
MTATARRVRRCALPRTGPGCRPGRGRGGGRAAVGLAAGDVVTARQPEGRSAGTGDP